MANIASRDQLTDIDLLDLGFVQDVSDTSEGSTGKSKKFEYQDLIKLMNRMCGQIKVNDGNGVKPTQTHNTPSAGTPSTEQIIDYALPLGLSSSPTTTYPPMDTVQDETSIWDDANTSFIENLLPGQVNLWRFVFDWDKSVDPAKKFSMRFRLFNPLSAFSITDETYLSEEFSQGEYTATFLTIADSASLPAPLGTGNGYQLGISIIGDNSSDCDITLDSATRVSLASSLF